MKRVLIDNTGIFSDKADCFDFRLQLPHELHGRCIQSPTSKSDRQYHIGLTCILALYLLANLLVTHDRSDLRILGTSQMAAQVGEVQALVGQSTISNMPDGAVVRKPASLLKNRTLVCKSSSLK